MKEPDATQRQRLFYYPAAGASPPDVGARVRLEAQQSHHLLHVLRIPLGGRLHVTDGRGALMVGRLAGRVGDRAEIAIEEVVSDETAVAAPWVVLACAVVKGRRFEWVVEKAVELGVHRLVPLLTEHAVVHPRSGKRQRWQALALAALKQSRRCFLPVVADPTPLAELLATPADGPRFWGTAVASGSATSVPVSWSRLAERFGPGTAAAPDPRERPATLTLLIGPEGGWSASEAASLAAAGAEPLTFGPHVLRSETAAVAGMLALQPLRDAWLAS